MGRPRVVAQHFSIDASEIERYLTVWDAEALGDDPDPAYPEDEFTPFDCWQLCDFMKKLGFPYDWD